jgi:hypothetical protein
MKGKRKTLANTWWTQWDVQEKQEKVPANPSKRLIVFSSFLKVGEICVICGLRLRKQ